MSICQILTYGALEFCIPKALRRGLDCLCLGQISKAFWISASTFFETIAFVVLLDSTTNVNNTFLNVSCTLRHKLLTTDDPCGQARKRR